MLNRQPIKQVLLSNDLPITVIIHIMITVNNPIHTQAIKNAIQCDTNIRRHLALRTSGMVRQSTKRIGSKHTQHA